MTQSANMRLILLFLAMMGGIPNMAILNSDNSNSAPVLASAIDQIQAAQRVHNMTFFAYVLLLVLAALGTYLSWETGNKVQNAVKADADARIAEAKRGVHEADTKAVKAAEQASLANERAKNLENVNLTLRAQVATIEVSAAKARGDVARLQKEAADAKALQQKVEADLATAQANLEKERVTRLNLQRSVLQRTIAMRGSGNTTNFDSLKRFKSTRVVFEYWPDGEPGNFSGNLAPFAMNSGWTMLGKWWNIPANRKLEDGVTIEAYVGPNGETDDSSQAADAMAQFLIRNGILGVRRVSAVPGELPLNSVRVLIGPMPDPWAHTTK